MRDKDVFVTYGDLAAASSVEWRKARLPLPHQLGRLVYVAHERGWPLLSAIVVNRGQVDTGALEGESLAGFPAAAQMVGLKVEDPQAFLREQQKAVFEWAKTAPDELGVPEEEPEGGPVGPASSNTSIRSSARCAPMVARPPLTRCLPGSRIISTYRPKRLKGSTRAAGRSLRTRSGGRASISRKPV